MNNWKLLHGRVNQFTLARAYLQGDIDLEVDGDLSDVFVLRDQLPGGTTITQAALLLGELALVAPTRVNAGVIKRHYDVGEDFHLLLPRRAVPPLLDADLRRRPRAVARGCRRGQVRADAQALGLKPGDHILDIGGGWGALPRYCGKLGVTVTSLTISEDSEGYIKDVIAEHDPGADVIREDLLDHHAWQRYDHVVIFGVIEHIPNYARFCERVWDALKPGGKLYMDASATKEKYAASAFTRRYTWTGAHSCLVLPDMLQELIFHGFHVEQVRNETEDYRLTMRKWAEKLDRPDRRSTSRDWGDHHLPRLPALSLGRDARVHQRPPAGLRHRRRARRQARLAAGHATPRRVLRRFPSLGARARPRTRARRASRAPIGRSSAAATTPAAGSGTSARASPSNTASVASGGSSPSSSRPWFIIWPSVFT